MQAFEGKTPAERNKMILMIALCAVALLLVAWSLGLFSGSSKTVSNTNGGRRARSRPTPGKTLPGERDETLVRPQPIVYTRPEISELPGTGRNIFAYYTAPVRSPQAANGTTPSGVMPTDQTPPPTPAPPLILAGVSPSNIYARTKEFMLQVSGDKFTPAVRVYFGGNELQTRFVSPQQLTASVPAMLITSQGNREIVVRTEDNQLFSNTMTFNVTPPPAPPYTYVGLLGGPSYNDTAVLRNRGNELLNVQRGDVVGGRFRVTSISERAIEFTDTELNIRHTLPAVEGRTSTPGNRYNPPPAVVSDDDEPQ